MHGMHVLAANAPSLRVPRCCGRSSTRFPGLWYPVTVALIYVSNDSSKASAKVLARLSPIRVTRCHHNSDLRIISFPFPEVGALTFGKS